MAPFDGAHYILLVTHFKPSLFCTVSEISPLVYEIEAYVTERTLSCPSRRIGYDSRNNRFHTIPACDGTGGPADIEICCSNITVYECDRRTKANAALRGENELWSSSMKG